MSLDSLFQQVLLTEQQQSEQIQKLKDGTFLFLAIIKLAASFVLKKNMRFRQQHCRLRIFVVFIKKKRYLSDICISVKVSIIKCNEKIKNATEKYENIKEELNKKVSFQIIFLFSLSFSSKYTYNHVNCLWLLDIYSVFVFSFLFILPIWL